MYKKDLGNHPRNGWGMLALAGIIAVGFGLYVGIYYLIFGELPKDFPKHK